MSCRKGWPNSSISWRGHDWSQNSFFDNVWLLNDFCGKKKGLDQTRTEPVLNPLFTRTNPLFCGGNPGFWSKPRVFQTRTEPVLHPYFTRTNPLFFNGFGYPPGNEFCRDFSHNLNGNFVAGLPAAKHIFQLQYIIETAIDAHGTKQCCSPWFVSAPSGFGYHELYGRCMQLNSERVGMHWAALWPKVLDFRVFQVLA